MITKTIHGITKTGKEVPLYSLQAGAYTATISAYGGTLVNVLAPDREGKVANVILSRPTLRAYEEGKGYLGALIGRYANRIAKGMFTIDGTVYHIPTNEKGINALHGGTVGFDKHVWESEADEKATKLRLSLSSGDGDMGFPGNLEVTVTYELNESGELKITYDAHCDKKCPVNLTNHAYFNLAGAGTVLDHVLRLACDRYLPVDHNLIPTGAIEAVASTPFDFRKAKPIGRDIGQAGGYDHCMILAQAGEGLKECAFVSEPKSGRTMTVFTTMEAVQFYSGTYLDGTPFVQYGGFCLETEHYPDAMNHDNFPSCILTPQERYHHVTIYKLSVAS